MANWTRGVLALVLCGCPAKDEGTGSPPTDTDGDADTDADSDADTDTDPSAEVYAGTMIVEASESGIVVNTESCEGAMTLDIDAAGVVGVAQCDLPGTLVGRTFEITLRGDAPVAGALSGTATVEYTAFAEPIAGTWEGTTDGTTLTGTSVGSWAKGEQGFDWSATFELTRP